METYIPTIINVVLTIINGFIALYFFRLQQKIKANYQSKLETMRIEYSSLYLKRAIAIEELYGKLYKISKTIGIIRWTETEKEFLRNVSLADPCLLEKEMDSLVDFYNEKRIYFSASTFKKLEKFTGYFYQQIEDYNNKIEEEKGKEDALVSFGLLLFKGDWKNLLDTIIEDFQKLIGVNNGKV